MEYNYILNTNVSNLPTTYYYFKTHKSIILDLSLTFNTTDYTFFVCVRWLNSKDFLGRSCDRFLYIYFNNIVVSSFGCGSTKETTAITHRWWRRRPQSDRVTNIFDELRLRITILIIENFKMAADILTEVVLLWVWRTRQ